MMLLVIPLANDDVGMRCVVRTQFDWPDGIDGSDNRDHLAVQGHSGNIDYTQ